MKLLFLDTETNGLKPSQNQIIEVAGIIAQLNPVSLELTILDSFSSLIALRQDYDPKIQRLTGITKSELDTSLPLHKVQAKWSNFLNNHEDIKAIVAHSIDFDMGFLESESWQIPFKAKTIDTLDLSKILLPQLSAVNLEFISKTLDIRPKTLDLSDHRALYDTKVSINLYLYLLKLLNNIYLPQEWFEVLVKKYFGIDFPMYLVKTKPKSLVVEIGQYFQNLEQKKPSLNFADQIKLLDVEGFLSLFDNTTQLPLDLKRLVLQILVIYYNYADKAQPRLHINNRTYDYTLASLLLESKSNQIAVNIQIEAIENILSKYSVMASDYMPIYKIIDLIAILKLLGEQSQVISEVNSSYDFFLLGLQGSLYYGEYKPQKFDAKIQDQIIQEKFEIFYSKLLSLKEFSNSFPQPVNNPKLISLIYDKIYELLTNIQDYSRPYKIIFKADKMQLQIEKKDFKLEQYLSSLCQLNSKNLEFQSYLDTTQLSELASNLKLDFSNYMIKTLDFGSIEITNSEIDLNQLVEHEFELLEKTKIRIILTTRNKDYNRLEDHIIKNYSKEQYLIVGESGSLTKIVSKAKAGFSGLVLLKHTGLEYFAQNLAVGKIQSIKILDFPFFEINPQLLARSKFYDVKEAQKYFYRINAISRARKIQYLTKSAVEIILN